MANGLQPRDASGKFISRRVLEERIQAAQADLNALLAVEKAIPEVIQRMANDLFRVLGLEGEIEIRIVNPTAADPVLEISAGRRTVRMGWF